MINNKISILSRLLLVVAAAALVVSIFVPIWRIELAAPQYPEGLAMLIYADKLGGDVDIINGLNHYIGMQTLHAENFFEFTALPYLIGFFAFITLLTAIIGRKKVLYALLGIFFSFGVIAMADFWRWEYNYGHNLDPHAAIIVPGMAYQPPLIGFKQLLNFGAYSVPDFGGWLFIGSGLLMLLATVYEAKFRKPKLSAGLFFLPLIALSTSCSTGKPEPIVLNKDNCDFCKMTIADGRFGCELLTNKGRVYKFDDLGCMLRYKVENMKLSPKEFFINDFTAQNVLLPAESAFYVYDKSFGSPMGGNIAAFKSETEANAFAQNLKAEVQDWKVILK